MEHTGEPEFTGLCGLPMAIRDLLASSPTSTTPGSPPHSTASRRRSNSWTSIARAAAAAASPERRSLGARNTVEELELDVSPSFPLVCRHSPTVASAKVSHDLYKARREGLHEVARRKDCWGFVLFSFGFVVS